MNGRTYANSAAENLYVKLELFYRKKDLFPGEDFFPPGNRAIMGKSDREQADACLIKTDEEQDDYD